MHAAVKCCSLALCRMPDVLWGEQCSRGIGAFPPGVPQCCGCVLQQSLGCRSAAVVLLCSRTPQMHAVCARFDQCAGVVCAAVVASWWLLQSNMRSSKGTTSDATLQCYRDPVSGHPSHCSFGEQCRRGEGNLRARHWPSPRLGRPGHRRSGAAASASVAHPPGHTECYLELTELAKPVERPCLCCNTQNVCHTPAPLPSLLSARTSSRPRSVSRQPCGRWKLLSRVISLTS